MCFNLEKHTHRANRTRSHAEKSMWSHTAEAENEEGKANPSWRKPDWAAGILCGQSEVFQKLRAQIYKLNVGFGLNN